MPTALFKSDGSLQRVSVAMTECQWSYNIIMNSELKLILTIFMCLKKIYRLPAVRQDACGHKTLGVLKH